MEESRLWVMLPCSVERGQAAFFYDTSPFLHLSPEEGRELLRPAADRHVPLLRQAFLEVGRLHGLDRRRGQFFDDVLRRRGRREQTEPAAELVPRHAGFGDRRQV